MRIHKHIGGDRAAAARMWPFARRKLNQMLAFMRRHGIQSHTQTIAATNNTRIHIQVNGLDAHVHIRAGDLPYLALGPYPEGILQIRSRKGRVLAERDFADRELVVPYPWPGGMYAHAWKEYSFTDTFPARSIHRLDGRLRTVWQVDFASQDVLSGVFNQSLAPWPSPEGSVFAHRHRERRVVRIAPDGAIRWEKPMLGLATDDPTVGDYGDAATRGFLGGQWEDRPTFEAGYIRERLEPPDYPDYGWAFTARVVVRDGDGTIRWQKDRGRQEFYDSYPAWNYGIPQFWAGASSPEGDLSLWFGYEGKKELVNYGPEGTERFAVPATIGPDIDGLVRDRSGRHYSYIGDDYLEARTPDGQRDWLIQDDGSMEWMALPSLSGNPGQTIAGDGETQFIYRDGETGEEAFGMTVPFDPVSTSPVYPGTIVARGA